MNLARAGISEFIGVFLLVFAGCAAAISVGGGLYPVAFAVISLLAAPRAFRFLACRTWKLMQFGLGVMVMCYATADVSGGHLNPAISFAFAVTQEIDIRRCLLYVICQCLGAVSGALFLKGSWPIARTCARACMLVFAATPAPPHEFCGLGSADTRGDARRVPSGL